MTGSGSILLTTYSPARAALYTALVRDRAAQWNVAELASKIVAMSAGPVSRDSIRAALLMLLDDQVAREIPDRDLLTVQLSSDGANILNMILTGWRNLGEQVPT